MIFDITPIDNHLHFLFLYKCMTLDAAMPIASLDISLHVLGGQRDNKREAARPLLK